MVRLEIDDPDLNLTAFDNLHSSMVRLEIFFIFRLIFFFINLHSSMVRLEICILPVYKPLKNLFTFQYG